MRPLVLATIVDTQALLETILAALAGGVGVALTFSLAILGSTRLAEASRAGHRWEAAFFGALAFFGLVASIAAIAFGILVMTSS